MKEQYLLRQITTLENELVRLHNERQKEKKEFASLKKRFDHLADNEINRASCCVANEDRVEKLEIKLSDFRERLLIIAEKDYFFGDYLMGIANEIDHLLGKK